MSKIIFYKYITQKAPKHCRYDSVEVIEKNSLILSFF